MMWNLDYLFTKLFIYQCCVDAYMAKKAGNSKSYAQAMQDKSIHEGRLLKLELNRSTT